MILYQIKGCPFALRTRVVLSEKQLAFDTVYIDPRNKPPEVLTVSPAGLTPVLYDGALKLRESAVIDAYLEERYPQPALMPTSLGARAEVRLAIADLGPLFGAVGDLFRATAEARAAAEQKIDAILSSLNARLAGSTFLVGDALSLADVYLFAHLVSLARLRGAPLPESLPHLRGWFERVSSRPAVQRALAGAMA